MNANSPTHGAEHSLQQLLIALPECADRILDLHLALSQQQQPGVCVQHYFDLIRSVPQWRRHLISELRQQLEQRIQIHIVLHESQQRQLQCLNLGDADSLEHYCRQAMETIAAQYPDEARLQISFDWAQPHQPSQHSTSAD